MSLEPALKAALIAAIVAIFSLLVNSGLHIWKARIDRQIAREKAKADLDLADRKFNLDVQLADMKRKADLAEQALIAVYEARDVFAWVRSRGILQGEGETRPANLDEADGYRDQRNTYYIPIERLNRDKEVFARLQALRYAFAAHFGDSAAKPFEHLRQVHNRITVAANVLIQIASTERNINDSEIPLRNELGWGPRTRPDELDNLIDQAVIAMETTCAPILRAKVERSAAVARKGVGRESVERD